MDGSPDIRRDDFWDQLTILILNNHLKNFALAYEQHEILGL